MKSILLSGVVASLLLFSGCSEKAPLVDTKPQVVQEVVEETPVVETETVTAEKSVVQGTDLSRLASAESKLQSVYFDYDKFEIKSNMQETVSSDAKVAKSIASDYKVKLEGNCDEWGSDEYNFALGLKRANSVKKALVAQGVSASDISMVSYGESNPTCTDKTQECWSKNRRVDFSLLP